VICGQSNRDRFVSHNIPSTITSLALTDHRSPITYHFVFKCAVSSVVEHYLDTVGVRGSNPLSRTTSPRSL
jgi:hypothetical protein